MINKYLVNPELNTSVTTWINTVLSNYLSKTHDEQVVNPENQTEIEHIIDF